MTRRLLLLLLSLAAAPLLRADPPAAGEVLTAAGADHFRAYTNPWLGFNKDRAMWGQVERYIVVDDTGRLGNTAFPVSIDAADFRKKGVPDIVMVDGEGFLRYFPNSGTKEAPKFAEGIVLPVLLGYAPYQVQAVDYDNDGLPDLVMGDDDGYFYMLRNQGGGETPRFESPKKLDQIRSDITGGGDPWCNYVSPAYAQWRPGGSTMDLVLGDGTYASDNIYYLRNSGSNEHPKFDPKVLLITGDGRQHLTARACNWVSKDKPDLLVGERNGGVMLYVNDTAPGDALPKFKPAKALSVGGNARFAPLGRLATADLNGDGKPDLLWSDTQGAVWYALNTGSAADPVFGAAVALTCADAPKPYAIPTGWCLRGNWGVQTGLSAGGFFYFLHTVGTDSQNPATFEQGLAMPEGSPSKYAVKFEFMPQPAQFTAPYPPYVDKDGSDGVYTVFYTDNGYNGSQFALKEKTPYRLSFQIKGDGFSRFTVTLLGTQPILQKNGGRETYLWKSIGFEKDISVGSSWHQYELPHSFQFDKDVADIAKDKPGSFTLCFQFAGKGTFYLTDVSLKPVVK